VTFESHLVTYGEIRDIFGGHLGFRLVDHNGKIRSNFWFSIRDFDIILRMRESKPN
jgi:hypothetical protein